MAKRNGNKALEKKEQNVLMTNCKGSNANNLIEIATATPPRRQTFTVVKESSRNTARDRSDKFNNNKENVASKGNGACVDRKTFNIEAKEADRDASKSELFSTSKDLTVGKSIDDKSIGFGEGAVEKYEHLVDTCVLDANTFRECEIRLSSSPIKWLQGCNSNQDLRPGQVVMNGEVKHQFMPYPSFNNTDTFLNMEMSTGHKKRHDFPDESLSFGSTASSLFTISHEDRFAPHLEAVEENSDLATNFTSKTLTSRDCNEDATNTTTLVQSEERSLADVVKKECRQENVLPKDAGLNYSKSDLQLLATNSGEDRSETGCVLRHEIPIAEGHSGIFSVCDEMAPASTEQKRQGSRNGILLEIGAPSRKDKAQKNQTKAKTEHLPQDQVDSEVPEAICFQNPKCLNRPVSSGAQNAGVCRKQTEQLVVLKQADAMPNKRPSVPRRDAKKPVAKSIDARYLTSQSKPRVGHSSGVIQSRQREPKNGPYIIDAKFKAASSLTLPQKRKGGVGK